MPASRNLETEPAVTIAGRRINCTSHHCKAFRPVFLRFCIFFLRKPSLVQVQRPRRGDRLSMFLPWRFCKSWCATGHHAVFEEGEKQKNPGQKIRLFGCWPLRGSVPNKRVQHPFPNSHEFGYVHPYSLCPRSRQAQRYRLRESATAAAADGAPNTTTIRLSLARSPDETRHDPAALVNPVLTPV